MKNETLYWTIGGVALALLALYAMSRGGGSSSTTSSSGGAAISAADLTSQVNTVNNNAAAVEATLINAQAGYVVHATDAQAGAFQTLADNATAQLTEVENAGSSRYINRLGAMVDEYNTHENALTTQFEATQQTARAADANRAQLEADKLAADVAHFSSDNAVTVARINKGSSFGNFMQSLLGSVTSIFSNGFSFGGAKSPSPSSTSAPPALPALSMGGMSMSR